ncbi:MAG TPA: DNA primase [Usitatibacteraceae bacterium]|nr:DNA primase [Usitatibacteraceae bacterium]
MIPPDFIQQLLGRVDIVEVIDRQVKLKKAGQNYSACCPFHNEKTPSFTVSPAKQFYHCFGCGAHGTAIGFLIEYNGMGFRDAVKELAESVGMSVPAESPQAIEQAQAALSLTDVLGVAAAFYRNQLKQSPKAIDYLKGRGLTGEIAARFGLGYAPDDWQGLKGVVADYTASSLVDSGLVIDRDGKRYDRFRDRVMFPILDSRGSVIGFGGRVIGEGEPKYLNSPETPLFEKGRELYGLFQARRAIRDTQTVIVVEGYMDVVALAQSGVENAVATLGTATTSNHVQKLLRVAENLVFCFDGDAAGRRAAWRALEQSLPVFADGKDVRFMFLPAEDDPDTYVRRVGKEQFLSDLAAAKPLSAFLFEELEGQADMSSEEGRTRFLSLARPYISAVSAPALGMMLQRKLAERIGLGLIEIQQLVPTAGGRDPSQRPGPGPRSAGNAEGGQPRPSRDGLPQRRKVLRDPPATQLIVRMLAKPQLAGRFDVPSHDGDTSPTGSAYRVAAFIRDHDFEVTQAMVIEHFRDTPDQPLIAHAAAHPLLTEIDTEHPDFDIDAEFDEALARLRDQALADAEREAVMKRAAELGLS